ncbi:MAG: NAD(P)H-binding protein [Actinomycetota bacterium]|nr:NAD(P)H-binding protein [Actinomycetota bacterium]
MKIVIAGGAGRIGSRIARALDDQGYSVVVASPRHGIDALTGLGLAEAFANADVVIDTTNLPAAIPYSEAEKFFGTATTNLLRAGEAAGVKHHLLLSVVGVDRVNSHYFRGKEKQEHLVRDHGVPFSIVRSTSVLEALRDSVLTDPELGAPRVPNLTLQPVTALDLARVVTRTIAAAPRRGLIEVAGPETLPLPELATRMMRATGDLRHVVVDHTAEYLGTVFEPGDTALLPDLRVGSTSVDEWLVRLPA